MGASKILENESEDKSVLDILKGVNTKQVVHWIASAWVEAGNDSLCKALSNFYLESEYNVNVSEGECSDLSCTDVVEAAAQLGDDMLWPMDGGRHS